jgi:YesN/AraC family two-component response regulator
VYRVLLADDMTEFRAWLGALLEHSPDFTVVGEAGDGGEALRLAGTLQPDVVLADVEMPAVDGLDLARAMRTRWPAVKVILFSGHTSQGYARLATAEGAVAFIPKTRLSVAAVAHALAGAE